MKRLLPFVIAIFFFTNGYAQEEYDEPEVNIDSLLINIDKEGFTSGVLYERVFRNSSTLLKMRQNSLLEFD